MQLSILPPSDPPASSSGERGGRSHSHMHSHLPTPTSPGCGSLRVSATANWCLLDRSPRGAPSQPVRAARPLSMWIVPLGAHRCTLSAGRCSIASNFLHRAIFSPSGPTRRVDWLGPTLCPHEAHTRSDLPESTAVCDRICPPIGPLPADRLKQPVVAPFSSSPRRCCSRSRTRWCLHGNLYMCAGLLEPWPRLSCASALQQQSSWLLLRATWESRIRIRLAGGFESAKVD